MVYDNINIDFSINMTQQINKYVLEYLAGEDTRLQWDIRGIAGHRLPTNQELARLEESNKKITNFLQTEKGMNIIRSFAKECVDVYTKLLYDQKYIHDYLEGKKIIFVVGAVRTGGTHLLSKILESFNMKIEEYNLSMIHDDFPNYTYFYRWNEVSMFQGLLFEIAQFLVWAKHTFKDKPIIIKKRTGFIHILPFLYNVFGNDAEYILTVRHPVPSGFSIAKKQQFKIDEPMGLQLWKNMALYRDKASEEEFDKMNCMERFLIYWQICYEDVVRCLNPKQKIQIVTYDEQSNDEILTKIADKYNGKRVLAGFNAIKRTYPEIVSVDKVNEVIETVRKIWAIHGLKFPEVL